MKRLVLVLVCSVGLSLAGCSGCNNDPGRGPVSMTGVKEAVAEVKAGADGLTNEQRNIKSRLALENDPASVKHLYVFSSMTGKCLVYSTVRGKVTSSGKRLSPTTLQGWWTSVSSDPANGWGPGTAVQTPNGKKYTAEAIQDDGTYGDSIPYLYWFDTKGVFHQMYPPSGCVLHLATEPLAIPASELGIRLSKD